MTYTQPKPDSDRKPSKPAANPLIQRLVQPQIVANWSLDENGQVVCLWENPPIQRRQQK